MSMKRPDHFDYFGVALITIVAALCVFAFVQLVGAEEFLYIPKGNVYTVKVQAPPEADVSDVCIASMTPLEVEISCVPVTPDQIVEIEIQVDRTPHVDVTLRAFAYDTSGNRSEPSLDSGLIDFTPPGRAKHLP